VSSRVAGQDGSLTPIGLFPGVAESQESSLRVLAMLDSVSDGFCAVDSAFRCTYLNRRAEEILGLRREEMLDRHLWEVFPSGVGTVFDEAYTRVLRTGVPESFEAFYPEPLNIWIEVRAQPSADGLLLYFQDATARRAERLERERLLAAERTAREQAELARADTERALRLVAHQATHDALTGLVNRQEFARIAAASLAAPDAGPATAMLIDLDRFKLVNDSLGHAAGDALLVSVARRLRQVLPAEYPLARLGGDEFVVLLTGTGEEQAHTLAEQVLAGLREPLDVRGRSITTSASIGLASGTLGTTVETLLRDADVALYRAKDHGRDQVAWFDRTAHEQLMQRVSLENDLRAALERDELTLYFQPMYDATDDRLVGVEALSRWRHPSLGEVSPGLFIPLAEDTGLMRALGARVITMACEQAARWARIPDFTIWVNVSARQLDTPGLAAALLAELERAGVTADRIGVEVTESVFSDERSAVDELTRLAEAGVRIAIDDFGTGHSSLARLYRFPIDVLKIDQSFVHDIETNRGLAAVRAVVQLTEALGLSTVAEGIETPRQLELVREAGCHVGAGYLLGRPAPADELTPMLLGA
jgi:diguanylate cyclase (GGDEF)-like protein/PAS domain S-box-containing protein